MRPPRDCSQGNRLSQCRELHDPGSADIIFIRIEHDTIFGRPWLARVWILREVWSLPAGTSDLERASREYTSSAVRCRDDILDGHLASLILPPNQRRSYLPQPDLKDLVQAVPRQAPTAPLPLPPSAATGHLDRARMCTRHASHGQGVLGWDLNCTYNASGDRIVEAAPLDSHSNRQRRSENVLALRDVRIGSITARRPWLESTFRNASDDM